MSTPLRDGFRHVSEEEGKRIASTGWTYPRGPKVVQANGTVTRISPGVIEAQKMPRTAVIATLPDLGKLN